jgi:hypothetical protein
MLFVEVSSIHLRPINPHEMKKIFISALIIVFSFKSYSQIKYEPGYYIDNSGNVINCLIKNTDWKNNPKEFTYKLSIESEPQKGKIENISEFSVIDKFKFKRYSVDIDRSSNNLNDMGYNRAPEFKKEQLFLKTLFEGKASLYFYEGENLFKYFYSIDNSNAKQLIFKRYLDADNRVTKNYEFRKQLLDSLQCQSLSLTDVEKIEYDENDLIDFFTKYSLCQNSKTVIYHLREKPKKPLSLALRPGINVSNLSIENIATYTGIINFGTKASLRLGVQGEYILPFNKGKWAITLEPTFQYYKGESTSESKPIKADYKSIQFPIGITYFFFLNDKSKLFLNTSLIYDIPFDSKIDLESSRNPLKISSTFTPTFSLGYKYLKKYSLEARYEFGRRPLNYIFWGSEYKTFAVIFGYDLF